jgi:hypothetical protein
MTNNNKIHYLMAALLFIFSLDVLAKSLQMRCPEVRDYGGYPHTTGNFIQYKFDLEKKLLFRKHGGDWSVICDKAAKCIYDHQTVRLSEIRVDQKKIIDRKLDFLTQTEKAKEWSDIKKTRLVFGYESICH